MLKLVLGPVIRFTPTPSKATKGASVDFYLKHRIT